MLVSCLMDANATTTGNLEDDVSIIIANLFISDSFALRDILKIIRKADHDVNTRVNQLGAILVPGDIANDRWNQAACLLHFKEERRDIGERNAGTRFICRVYSATVDKSKLLVGVCLGYRVDRFLHQEPHANDHICMLCRCSDVFGVFSVTEHMRLYDHVWETVLFSSRFVTLMRKLVEATIVQAPNVSH